MLKPRTLNPERPTLLYINAWKAASEAVMSVSEIVRLVPY
jgi:hypothetical protein